MWRKQTCPVLSSPLKPKYNNILNDVKRIWQEDNIFTHFQTIRNSSNIATYVEEAERN